LLIFLIGAIIPNFAVHKECPELPAAPKRTYPAGKNGTLFSAHLMGINFFMKCFFEQLKR
jgi:hypothetical protein